MVLLLSSLHLLLIPLPFDPCLRIIEQMLECIAPTAILLVYWVYLFRFEHHLLAFPVDLRFESRGMWACRFGLLVKTQEKILATRLVFMKSSIN
jgi:hypothetical protein